MADALVVLSRLSIAIEYHTIAALWLFPVLLMSCCFEFVQVTELQDENSSVQKQLDAAQNVTGGTEPAGKVDRNANLPVIHVSDDLSVSDVKNVEAAEQQVVIVLWQSECPALSVSLSAFSALKLLLGVRKSIRPVKIE